MEMGLFKRSNKVFCVGFNKTGTTSLLKALGDWNYKVAPQGPAELLIHDYAKRQFDSLRKFAEKYDFFQDVPFSYPHTFIVMDQTFPSSKFILTVRKSGEEWFDSLCRFHSKSFGKNGNRPTVDDLKGAEYNYRGFAWDALAIGYNVSEENPYPKEMLIATYEMHNKTVKDYFRYRQDDLLILNLADSDAYPRLSRFLKKKPLYDRMPWENKT